MRQYELILQLSRRHTVGMGRHGRRERRGRRLRAKRTRRRSTSTTALGSAGRARDRHQPRDRPVLVEPNWPNVCRRDPQETPRASADGGAADSNRRRSQRPRPCDPRSPLTRLRRFLASRTEGSTDCATLRRRERSSAPGVAPVANEMWLQPRRRCRRSGEMWSHLTPTGPAKPVSATGRQRTADAILTSMIAMGTEPWSTNMPRPRQAVKSSTRVDAADKFYARIDFSGCGP